MYRKPLLTTALAGSMLTPAFTANSQVLLSDDFNGTGNIDTATWRLPFGEEGTFLGQTQLKLDPATQLPQQVGGSAVLELDTFFPDDPGNAFFGHEFISRQNFARGGGLRVEYRARLDPTSLPAGVGGVVNGLFLFGTPQDVGGELVRDEIDVAELLTNEVVSGQNRVFTNVFDDDPFTGAAAAGDSEFTAPGLVDLTQFNDYAVEWTPSSVDYFVNGALVRSESTVVPDAPQTVRANLWAVDAGFAEAFDAALTPAATAGANQTIRAEIDSIEVSRFNTDVSDNLLVNPGFETPGGIAANTSALTVGGWGSFNNVFQDAFGSEDSRVFEGEATASMFGTFNFTPDASGLFQDVPALPGQEFEASGTVITASFDSIVGTENFTELSLQFLDASGNVIGTDPANDDFIGDNQETFAAINGQDPNAVEDTFLTATVSAIAPAGTAFVRLQALFATPTGFEGGAVQWDDFSLVLLTESAIEALIGDFSGDGFVGQADPDLVLANFGSTVLPEGFDPTNTTVGSFDGLIGQNELDDVLANFGNSSGPAVNAIPEPTTAALVLLGGGALLARRRSQA
ncbi:MAG: family 16 glycosylhydrolase [Planctomycetota bacterium]